MTILEWCVPATVRDQTDLGERSDRSFTDTSQRERVMGDTSQRERVTGGIWNADLLTAEW